MDAIHAGITEEALMALGSDARVEVINGELIEMSPVGGLHHYIARNIQRILDQYALTNDSGEVFFDGLIFLLRKEGPGLKGAQVPDVSYTRNEHIPPDWVIERPFPGAPDLAIEVMSPDDKAEIVLLKTRKYLEAGGEEVWVVYPESRELHEYRHGDAADTVRVYRLGDTVDVEALFPGLTLRMADIFRLPARIRRNTDSQ